MLRKILVPIDESASSEWAFDTALAMAKSLKAELHLVHILNAFAADSPKHPLVSVENFSKDVESSTQKEYEQEWEQFKSEFGALLREKQVEAETAGVTATYSQAQGTPEKKICEVARTNNIDLIVAGNRDRTNQNSISNYLVRHAPCSVTIVHPKAHHQAVSNANLSRAVAV